MISEFHTGNPIGAILEFVHATTRRNVKFFWICSSEGVTQKPTLVSREEEDRKGSSDFNSHEMDEDENEWESKKKKNTWDLPAT